MKDMATVAHFLQGDLDWQSAYELSEAQAEALQRSISHLRQTPSLLEKAETYYRALFSDLASPLKPSKLCDRTDEENAGLFSVIYLARLSVLGETLEKKGIPARYAEKASWHYRDLLQRNYNRYGYYGFNGMYRDGMVSYLTPSRFTLGRLTYEIGKFRQYHTPYTVYQNQVDGSLLPLAKGGYAYLPNGKRASEDEKAVLMTTCLEKDRSLDGYTFDENGLLKASPISVSTEIWRSFLTDEDDVLWVHIPGGEALTPESVAESLREAKAFFSTYFPKTQFRAFVCSSWLLDTGLRAYLKEGSNILAFQKIFRIVMSHVNPMALYFNVFHVEEAIPLTELIPTNSFQARILEAMKGGGHLYSGNGFLLFSDVENIL